MDLFKRRYRYPSLNNPGKEGGHTNRAVPVGSVNMEPLGSRPAFWLAVPGKTTSSLLRARSAASQARASRTRSHASTGDRNNPL